MPRWIRVAVIVVGCCAGTGTMSVVTAQEGAPPALKLEGVKDKASYAIGWNIGNSLKDEGADLNADAIVRGLLDALQGKKAMLPPDQLRPALEAFQRELAAKQEARMQVLAEKNRKEGVAFLEANKTKPGVKVLPSGLQYKVLKSGNGPSPKLTDKVKTHYHGTLIDGTVFDSSVERGEPVEFPVGGVIRGWTEALQLMKVGDKWRLFVPSELAYGPQGAGGVIGPNATLVFEVELLEIVQ
jgi:FKBP-type peptidyl-prolyl cis-trans isomerase FklB